LLSACRARLLRKAAALVAERAAALVVLAQVAAEQAGPT
jgi:hypothetical protein